MRATTVFIIHRDLFKEEWNCRRVALETQRFPTCDESRRSAPSWGFCQCQFTDSFSQGEPDVRFPSFP